MASHLPDIQDERKQRIVVEARYKYQQLCRRRDGWRTIFYLLCKYIRMRPVWFGDTNTPWKTPNFSVANVSDDTTIDSARSSASSLAGALWPNHDESFEVLPKKEYDTEETRQFCQHMTHHTRRGIGSYEGRFLTANNEHLDENVVMGTSGIFAEENEYNDQAPFHFRSCSVETCVIDENAWNHVDTVIFEYNYSARQVVDRYGYENCSPRVRALFDGTKYDDYIRVIHIVEPRMAGKAGDVKTKKPYASLHIEYDSQWLLKEDGFDECPVFISRFRKLPPELYGRSLGMDALPSAKELNVLRGAFTQAIMLILRPPYGYYHDQIAGGGNFDMSPGARVALYATGRIPQGQMPIMPLVNIQLPPAAEARMQNLTEQINGKFLVDVLTDFNNKTRMTLGETEKRESLRYQALSGIFSRQLVEVYYPLVKWCVNVMFKRGLYGLDPTKDAVKIALQQNMGRRPVVIPMSFVQAMKQGKTPYEIRFISPAARAMSDSELAGLERFTNYALTLTNAGAIGVVDNVDTDVAIRRHQRLSGAPSDVIVSMEKTLQTRKTKAAQQAAMQQLQQQQAVADIAKGQGKATQDFAKAGQPNPYGQQMQQAS